MTKDHRVPLDPVDLRILALLQAQGRISNADLARELAMAPSAVFERTKKLEGRGIVTGFEARLAPKKLGLGLLAFVFVRANDDGVAVGAALARIEEVQEVHQVAGEDCYLIKLRARDTDELARILNEQVKPITGITATHTTIALGTLKETLQLPLLHLADKEQV